VKDRNDRYLTINRAMTDSVKMAQEEIIAF
jgi:hypothetical protein